MEGVVVSTLNFANRALVLLNGIGILAVLLACCWFKSRWREIARGGRWGDPWADRAFLSNEQPGAPQRERQVA